jgi:hypothetical protein
MNETLLVVAIAFAVLLGGLSYAAGIILKNRKKPLDQTYFAKKWQASQTLCANKETWPLAIINADKLLDEALKKCHYKGKSMGERLAAAQRDLSDNDGVWYGHKLRNRLVHESDVKLTKSNVRDALMGLRQALRDLGALK